MLARIMVYQTLGSLTMFSGPTPPCITHHLVNETLMSTVMPNLQAHAREKLSAHLLRSSNHIGIRGDPDVSIEELVETAVVLESMEEFVDEDQHACMTIKSKVRFPVSGRRPASLE